jgi:putative Holliday junction resolvase
VRFLGLDVGEKRIGVSIGDTEAFMARPLDVIRRRSRGEDFAVIAGFVTEWEVSRIVAGLPLTTEGDIGPQARRVKRYIRELGRVVLVPIDWVDERYTTVDAHEIMQTVGYSSKKRREQVDAVAAALILQSYLDRLREQEMMDRQGIDDAPGGEAPSA